MYRLVSLLLVSSFALFGESHFTDFDAYQGKWTRHEIEERLGRFLQKEGGVASFFSIDGEGLTLYDRPETEKNRKVEYKLTFAQELSRSKPSKRRSDLVGVKIALDPGHFGGPLARLEERFIDIPPSLERDEAIQFDEGTLCLLTAKYLKTLLEKEGAIVFLTREEIGQGAYVDDFFAWLKKHPEHWGRDLSLNAIFRRFYNPLDLRARAEKINAFGPDLSLILHYNSHDSDPDLASNHACCSGNFNMTFVPGAFCHGELAEEESRYEFMRLLVTDDLRKSLDLSRSVANRLYKHLHVPLVASHDNARYLKSVCMELSSGVYARNLALTRLVHGPICYGESLVQNNIDECIHLSRKDFVIDGIRCSSRVKQVAEAYFEGILDYILESDRGKQAYDRHHSKK